MVNVAKGIVCLHPKTLFKKPTSEGERVLEPRPPNLWANALTDRLLGQKVGGPSSTALRSASNDIQSNSNSPHQELQMVCVCVPAI